MSLIELATLRINDAEIREFLVDAKKSGRDEHRRGQWNYSKTSRGHYSIAENEVVSCKGKPVLQMSYQGHLMKEFLPYNIGEEAAFILIKRASNFLKQVLLRVEPENPFRGPEARDVRVPGFDELQYCAKSTGERVGESHKRDLTHFFGTEVIILNKGVDSTALLEGAFIGGLILGKDKL